MSTTNPHDSTEDRIKAMQERIATSFRVFMTTATEAPESKGLTADMTTEEKREWFFQRRHLERDHIIQAQHYDLRISAIRLTNAVNEASQRHGHNELETQLWGKTAVGAALYSSFLRGEERVKVQMAIANEDAIENEDSSLAHNVLVESFAVGELRGYAKCSHALLDKCGSDLASVVREGKARGVFTMKKVLYGLAKPYESLIVTSGDPAQDWQLMFDQSEQVPTFIHVQIDTTPSANGPAKATFCGGILVQVLAGPSDPSFSQAVEQGEIAADSTDGDRTKETDTERIKKMQLALVKKAVGSLNMRSVMESQGVVGYIDQMLKAAEAHAKSGNPKPEVVPEPPKVSAESLENIAKQNGWRYRPQAFFCRCASLKAVDRLKTLPIQLLMQIREEGKGERLTCGFCNSPTDVTHQDVVDAISQLAGENK